ncbi:MAG: hypothetical protein BWY76_02006 [bacterium ADurb.Bin429]|nr:MAG: hypothetical protein BWY76_02006 [bacterium ADurb.Bin429]
MLLPHLFGHARTELLKKGSDELGFFFPGVAINRQHFAHVRFRYLDAGKVNAVRGWQVANGRLNGVGFIAAAVENPLEHTQVFAEARPQIVAIFVLAEPIHVKDLRRIRHMPPHLQPVTEIVTHIVATEGQHRHRVTAHFAEFSELGGGAFGGHGGTDKDAMLPVERLIHQRREARAAPAEDDGGDGNAMMVLAAE